jgi:hypothetical protein
MDLGSCGALRSSTGTPLKPDMVDALCRLQSRVTLSTATLDSGGWLGLTTPGLAPRKKCRAWLDALTLHHGEASFLA